jgi:hypothetical protein
MPLTLMRNAIMLCLFYILGTILSITSLVGIAMRVAVIGIV